MKHFVIGNLTKNIKVCKNMNLCEFDQEEQNLKKSCKEDFK